MKIFIWIVVAVLALLLILALTYFIFLIRPRKTKKVKASLLCEYAHRGLHGRNVPENSLLAFELACRAGYGIELDIQLSKDGQVMVFHDFTLVRMTGHSGRVNELDCCELVKLKLAHYDLIITDIDMPKINGYDFIERLRNDEMYMDIPIIIMSSIMKDEALKRIGRLKIDGYIQKDTFSQPEFIEKIRETLTKYHA